MSAETYYEGFKRFLDSRYFSEEEKLHQLARVYLSRTNLSREIRKVVRKKSGIFYTEKAFPSPLWKSVEDSAFEGCAWDLTSDYGKGIIVEAFSNGSIIVRGAPDATTLLLLSEWRNDKNNLLKAFGKALGKPMIIAI